MGSFGRQRVLIGILGRRTFVSFALVTCVVVFLLAAINVASRYAMKQYIEDQLARVPWDISIYQTSELSLTQDVSTQLSAVPHVTAAEQLILLRTAVPATTVAYVDNEPLRSPWLSLFTATDPGLLPPDLRPDSKRAILVVVGNKAQMGDAYLNLQNREQFALRVDRDHQSSLVFQVPIARTIRVERNELNRWFMDQTNAPTMIPELGVMLVVPYDPRLLIAFDAVSRGVTVDLNAGHHGQDAPAAQRGFGNALLTDNFPHANPGEYFPDIIHVLRVDRGALVSGWDVDGSHARLKELGEQARKAAQQVNFRVALDNSSGILLERMSNTARVIGLISVLVALPLLWMAGLLLANLSGLLLLNERRTFGLLRLRGVSGADLGRSLLLAIGLGGLLGGVTGAALGTAIPILIYAQGWLPWDIVWKVQNPLFLAGFLAVGLGLSLAVSRRLVRYAAHISPLEASGRVAASESAHASVRFGALEAVALAAGGLKMAGWIAGWSFSAGLAATWLQTIERGVDFIAFPLFVYGVTTLIASRQKLLAPVLGPLAKLTGGKLGEFSVRHTATRPHRVAAFLMIVALMASVSLYPTVMTAVFDDKTERGARVQVGSEIQVTLNAPDLVSAEALARGGLSDRFALVRSQVEPLTARLGQTPGVADATYMVEALVEGLYMRGYGFNGVPIYLVGQPQAYLRAVYHEEALGETGPFSTLIGQLTQGQALISPALANYWQRRPGDQMPVGRDTSGTMLPAPLAGTVRFLPGIPLASVNDRETLVSARVDYVNYLFNNRAYLVVDPQSPGLANLDVLIPRVVLAIRTQPGVLDRAAVRERVLGALPVEPLDVRELRTEISRLGSDMYIFLARQNVQIYLFGGLLLALIGVVSVALSNYAEDRRTLGLLRVRGCGPQQVLQFFSSGLFAPSVLGLIFGALVSLVVGYGITNVVWELRELRTILTYLPTHLVVSDRTAVIAGVHVLVLFGTALLFSKWVFRKTAREGLLEG